MIQTVLVMILLKVSTRASASSGGGVTGPNLLPEYSIFHKPCSTELAIVWEPPWLWRDTGTGARPLLRGREGRTRKDGLPCIACVFETNTKHASAQARKEEDAGTRVVWQCRNVLFKRKSLSVYNLTPVQFLTAIEFAEIRIRVACLATLLFGAPRPLTGLAPARCRACALAHGPPGRARASRAR